MSRKNKEIPKPKVRSNGLPQSSAADFSGKNVQSIRPVKRQAQRRILMIDEATGETLGVMIEGHDKPPKEGDWLKLYRSACTQLAWCEDLGPESRVLLYLLGTVQWGNFVAATWAEISAATNVERKTAGRVLKILQDRKVLQTDKCKGVRGYRFNPNSVYCGTRQAQGAVIQRWNAMLTKLREDKAREQSAKIRSEAGG